jgi:hypothetical protein
MLPPHIHKQHVKDKIRQLRRNGVPDAKIIARTPQLNATKEELEDWVQEVAIEETLHAEAQRMFLRGCSLEQVVARTGIDDLTAYRISLDVGKRRERHGNKD